MSSFTVEKVDMVVSKYLEVSRNCEYGFYSATPTMEPESGKNGKLTKNYTADYE